MNKTKMTLAATGGAIALAVLVMAYFTWSAYSAKTAAIEGDDEEGVDGFETVMAKAENLSGMSAGKVFPCPASVKAVVSNMAVIASWKEEALKLASRGDRPIKVTTPAQFKSDIVEEAKRLSALPGVASGKLVKPDFAFGPFKPYVAEGQMPAEAQLTRLTRQWDDVVTVVETLAANGIAELLDVQFRGAAEPEKKDDSAGRKKGRRPAKAAAAAAETADDAKVVSHSYVFTFATRAPGLVKSVNALTTSERFITIDNLTFTREKDVIAEALGGDEKQKGAEAAGGRRGRRGRRVVEKAEEKEDNGKNGIITDPLLDAPLRVELTVTVFDFRSMEEDKAEEKKGETK